jgi:hypothetical protein
MSIEPSFHLAVVPYAMFGLTLLVHYHALAVLFTTNPLPYIL